MKKILIILIMAAAFTACKKDSDKATLKVQNQSEYRILFKAFEKPEGNTVISKTIGAMQSETFTLNPNWYELFYEEIEGPSPRSSLKHLEMKAGQSYNWDVP